MNLSAVIGVTAMLTMMFSATMLVPAGIGLYYGEPTVSAFVITFAATLVFGLQWWTLLRADSDLSPRDGFLITVLFYVVLGLFGALPLWLSIGITGSFTDALFESFSAITTTGATVLSGLDEMPKSVLFYRQMLQWLGGMGIVVLAVAILPMLGVGGMQLFQAETPGPIKDMKIRPRIAETAKTLWLIYVGMTAICAGSYWIAGMSGFDAICHAFSTIAIGGFSTHDASIGYFDSVAVETVCIVFMALAAISFALHFTAWNDTVWSRLVRVRRGWGRPNNGMGWSWSNTMPRRYLYDSEVRLLFGLLLLFSFICSVFLLTSDSPVESPIRDAIFYSVSLVTTSGFTTTDITIFPLTVPILLLFGSFAGGCAGSTAGGVKLYRVLLLFRQYARELKRIIHPRGVFPIKLGGRTVPDEVIQSIWGFFGLYVLTFVVMVIAVSAVSGKDFLTVFSAVAACINNLGPGLGDVASNYQGLNDPTKYLLVLTMLLGRLELFTLAILFTVSFWRR